MLVNKNQVTHVSYQVVDVFEGKVTGHARFADGSVENLTSIERARELQSQVFENSQSSTDQLLLG